MLEKKNPSIQFSSREKIQPWSDDMQSTFFPVSVFSRYCQATQATPNKTSNPFFVNKIKRQPMKRPKNQLIVDPILIRNQISDQSKTQNVSPIRKNETPKVLNLNSTNASPQRANFSLEKGRDQQQAKFFTKTFIHSNTLNKFKKTKITNQVYPQFAYYMNRSSTKIGNIVSGKNLKMPSNIQIDQLRIGNSKSNKSIKRMTQSVENGRDLKVRRLTQPINNVSTGLLIQRKLYLLAHQQHPVNKLKKIINPILT